jgi:hypothetical protein
VNDGIVPHAIDLSRVELPDTTIKVIFQVGDFCPAIFVPSFKFDDAHPSSPGSRLAPTGVAPSSSKRVGPMRIGVSCIRINSSSKKAGETSSYGVLRGDSERIVLLDVVLVNMEATARQGREFQPYFFYSFNKFV